MSLALTLALLVGGGGKIEWTKFNDGEKLADTLAKTSAICMVYFTADWWKFCTRLDAGAFSNDDVVAASQRFRRILVDCTDKAFYAAMSAKYELQGLPTLAFFAGSKKLDELVGYSPSAKTYLDLMAKIGGKAGPQDERVEAILKRIEKELQESAARLREEVRKLVKAELEKIGTKPTTKEKTFEEQLTEFAKKIRDDADVNSRLKKLLLSKEGQAMSKEFMAQQGFDSIQQVIDAYFEKHKDGTFTVLGEYEDQVRAMLDQYAPPEEKPPAKGRAYFGITPDDFTDEQRKALGLEKGHGIRVQAATPGGPAEKAGLKAGDVVLSVGGRKVGEENIAQVLGALRPGEKVEVVVLRGRDKVTLEVTLGEKKE